MKLTKRLLSTLLVAAALLSLLTVGASAAGFTRTRTYTPGMFTDVADNHWAASSIKDCYELGLMSGSSGTTFDPAGMYNVAQALTIAARMHNIYNGGNGVLPSTTPWYQGAVNYCLSNGIITQGQFNSYERNVTRGEMAMLIVAAMPSNYWTVINDVSELPDVSPNTDYCSAIFKLYNAGILTGSDDGYGTFHPYAYITRAEVAAIVARCADPALRKTFTLKPPSEREAPEIVTYQWIGDWKVSNGLMLFQDPDTYKYGYLNASTGKVAISAQYADARNFVDGYAMVKLNNKWGVIDTNGNLTVPMNYSYIDDLGYGVYSARVEYGTLRCVIVQGKIATDHIYQETRTNGLYIFGRSGNDSWDILDMNGTKLAHVEGTLYSAKNSPLFKVKDGNKWALATAQGKITEAIYDDIQLTDNSPLALAKYGKQWALCGLNGLVNGLELGVATYQCIQGDYAIVKKDGQYALADTNGVLGEFCDKDANEICLVGNLLLTYNWNGTWRFAYDRATGETITTFAGGRYGEGYVMMTDGAYIMLDGTKCSSINNIASNYYTFTTLDGKHGLLHSGKVVSEGIYDTPEEAIAAYGFYKSGKENSKPVIYYGNDVSGFTPVIQFYKNNMYYDEIRSIGEGYYACKYNTTWYLLHA